MEKQTDTLLTAECCIDYVLTIMDRESSLPSTEPLSF